MPHVIPILMFVALALGWGASAGAKGYVVEWGPASGDYTESRDVGDVTTVCVPGFTPGQTYFVAVLAYDANGTASGPSNEVVFEAAEFEPIKNVTFEGGNFGFIVTGTAPEVTVWESTDLKNWSLLETSGSLAGSLMVVDPEAGAPMAKFYKVGN